MDADQILVLAVAGPLGVLALVAAVAVFYDEVRKWRARRRIDWLLREPEEEVLPGYTLSDFPNRDER